MNVEQFQKLPTASITKAMVDSQTECYVCYDQFHFNETGVRKLPCNHLYHDNCIFPWIERDASCPYCRAKFPLTNIVNLNDLGKTIKLIFQC